MPRSHPTWSLDRPAEGFYTSELAAFKAMPIRTFLPQGYEPNYPYPLLVFFHGQGSNEEQILRLAPRLSRRNYICISLRGPESLGPQADGHPGYGWGSEGEYDSTVEEYMLRAVEQTRRTYHVHSERIFLAGFCEGASLAYRLGLSMPEQIGGLIAMNGIMPRPDNTGPLFRFDQMRGLRVLMGHGIANAIVPLTMARNDFRLLYSAGADIRLLTYPTTHRIHPEMLRDINRWIMDRVNADTDNLLIDRCEDEETELDLDD